MNRRWHEKSILHCRGCIVKSPHHTHEKQIGLAHDFKSMKPRLRGADLFQQSHDIYL